MCWKYGDITPEKNQASFESDTTTLLFQKKTYFRLLTRRKLYSTGKKFALKLIHKTSENDGIFLVWQYKIDGVGKIFDMKSSFSKITRKETAKPIECWDWTKKNWKGIKTDSLYIKR